MFEHVLRHLPWQYIVWWSQKWKSSVKKKNSGNSVHLRTSIYCHVLSISKHIPLILCISFVMPSSYFLLFINALIHFQSTAHCILESKVKKRICADHSILPFWGLFDGQASQAGLATPKLPQPRVDLIDIAAPPSVHCSRVGTAIRKALRLLNMWGIVGVELPARNNGIRGTLNSPHHILDIGHVEAGGWGWSIQLDHSSVLHSPLDRQFGLFKSTE